MDLLKSSKDGVSQPNMDLAQKLYKFDVDHKRGIANDTLRDEIIQDLENDFMTPLYIQVAAKYSWSVDETKMEALRDENTRALQEIDGKHEEASKLGGNTDVLDIMISKAKYLSKIGSFTESMSAFDEIMKLPKTSTGKKIDIVLEKTRICLFTMDISKLQEHITEAKKLIDVGGDWDRRNRLKIYEALSLVVLRDFRQASVLFLDCIATFTCVELCSYQQFMFYAVMTSIISLSRTDLKKKLISNPQVIAIIRDMPELQLFLNSLYRCDYRTFFESILSVYPAVLEDRYVGPHVSFLVRECRILAYGQFLEAYRSVMMSSMAKSFGISLQLLDAELSRFIASGRLNAKVDKVGDVVETSRPDVKNAQYQETIKKGDALLNNIQRLIRVIDV